MFAVIETGGKQYLVKSGETLGVEKLDGAQGQEIVFDKVLLTADDDGANAKIGMPYVSGATVTASVQRQFRAKKIRVVKFKRKVRYKRVHGHRQHVTTVKIGAVA